MSRKHWLILCHHLVLTLVLIPIGEWSHVKVDLNAEEGKVRIFVNGEQVLEKDCPQKPMEAGDSPLRIGACSGQR